MKRTYDEWSYTLGNHERGGLGFTLKANAVKMFKYDCEAYPDTIHVLVSRPDNKVKAVYLPNLGEFYAT